MTALTAAQVRALLDYNPATGTLTWRERSPAEFTDGAYPAERSAAAWNAKFAGKPAGTVVANGYRYIRIKGRHYLAHRLAWLIVHGEWPADEIDHVNHDRDDNRLANLRAVDRPENRKNLTRLARNKSGTTGVHWYRSRNKWQSQITVRGMRKTLGYFDDLADAIAARKAAERKYGFHPNHGLAA